MITKGVKDRESIVLAIKGLLRERNFVPGEGGTRQSFIQGGSTLRSNLYPFIYHF